METIVNIVLGIVNLLFFVFNFGSAINSRIKRKKSTDLNFHVFWRNYGTCYLVIENKGMSCAESICISEPENLSGIFESIKNKIPNRIDPGSCALLLFPDHFKIPNESCVYVSWRDKYNSNNQKLIFLYFNLSEKKDIKPDWQR